MGTCVRELFAVSYSWLIMLLEPDQWSAQITTDVSPAMTIGCGSMSLSDHECLV